MVTDVVDSATLQQDLLCALLYDILASTPACLPACLPYSGSNHQNNRKQSASATLYMTAILNFVTSLINDRITSVVSVELPSLVNL